MNENTKLEVAKEIIYEQIGKATMQEKLTIKDKKLLDLLTLKKEINKNNMDAIDFVLNHLCVDGGEL